MSGSLALKLAPARLEHFVIRILTADDWAAYRSLRQNIIAIGDGRFFADSYAREAELTTVAQWRDWCTEKSAHCIFGSFVDGALVGVVMVTQLGPQADCIAEWEASWLNPRYRGSGITKAVYRQVQQWTMEQGYEYVRVFIRANNAHWQDVRRKLGFYSIGTKRALTWADGSVADAHIFELDLAGGSILDQSGDIDRRLLRSLAS